MMYETFEEKLDAILNYLRDNMPKQWWIKRKPHDKTIEGLKWAGLQIQVTGQEENNLMPFLLEKLVTDGHIVKTTDVNVNGGYAITAKGLLFEGYKSILRRNRRLNRIQRALNVSLIFAGAYYLLETIRLLYNYYLFFFH